MSLDIGIREGQSAAQMSRNVRQYLNKPNMLFRRVRDEHGELQLSKRAKAYHPGQGVYRSSYKNARRLTATETNIAYRTADHLRYQKMDFVVGIEIHLSGNHTLNGKPFHDICDELAGKYPKDFKFTGWHPQCRCFVTTILKTKEERDEDVKKILRGEPVDGESVNKVDDVPQQFKTWLKDNELRALNRFSVPYFMTENAGEYVPLKYITAYASKNPYDTFAEYEKAREYNKKHADFTKEQQENIRELNKVMPVVQGQIMSFGMADHHGCNPHFDDKDAVDKGYYHNCQTCTVAYELRRRGYYIEAKPNPISRKSNAEPYYYSDGSVVRDIDWLFMGEEPFMKYSERFLNADGTPATIDADSSKELVVRNNRGWKRLFILNNIIKEGRYELGCWWKRKSRGDSENSGHVFIIERQGNGNIIWYDPQSGKVQEFVDGYLDAMIPDMITITRIDDKLINPKFAKRFLRSN